MHTRALVHSQADDQLIVAAPLAELQHIDFGPPLHSLIIAGSVHTTEEEMLECYRVQNQPGLKKYTPALDAEEGEEDAGEGGQL